MSTFPPLEVVDLRANVFGIELIICVASHK